MLVVTAYVSSTQPGTLDLSRHERYRVSVIMIGRLINARSRLQDFRPENAAPRIQWKLADTGYSSL